MSVEKDVILTDTWLAELMSAPDVHEVKLVIRSAFADDDEDEDAY